jgi:hypothetical protein
MKKRQTNKMKIVKNQVKPSTELSDSEYQYLVELTGCTKTEIQGLFEKFKADSSIHSKADKIKFIKSFNNVHVLNDINE